MSRDRSTNRIFGNGMVPRHFIGTSATGGRFLGHFQAVAVSLPLKAQNVGRYLGCVRAVLYPMHHINVRLHDETL